MPVADEIQGEHRIAEIVDLAVRALVASLGITPNEASRALFIAAGQTLSPAAVSEAVKTISQSRKGMPYIA